jgi:hypothetical protein
MRVDNDFKVIAFLTQNIGLVFLLNFLHYNILHVLMQNLIINIPDFSHGSQETTFVEKKKSGAVCNMCQFYLSSIATTIAFTPYFSF